MSPSRRRFRHPALLVVAVAVLAGCSTTDPGVTPDPSPVTPDQDQADADPAAAPSPGSTPAAEGGDPPAATPGAGGGEGESAGRGARGPNRALALEASCRLQPEGPAYADAVHLAHPAGWDVGADQDLPCRFFDPEDVELPRDSEAHGVALRWTIDPVAFADAAAPGEAFEATRRLPSVVDERRALRLTGTATGHGGLPAGAEVVVWLVDVSGFGARAEPATLVASADADDPTAVDVLDRMIRAADVDPGGDGSGGDGSGGDGSGGEPARGGTTVARYAGGGAPFAVHHDRASGCLELFAGVRQGTKVSQACEVGAPDPLAAARLTRDPHDVAVGVTTADVDVVRLRTNADTTRAVATVPLADGRRGFALPLAGTEATLVAETFDGRVLGSHALVDAGS